MYVMTASSGKLVIDTDGKFFQWRQYNKPSAFAQTFFVEWVIFILECKAEKYCLTFRKFVCTFAHLRGMEA